MLGKIPVIILDIISAIKQRNPVKLVKTRKVISTFVFLTAIAKVQLLEGRLSTRLCLHSNLRFFNISNFLKIQVLSHLATLEETHIPSFLHQISRFDLLEVNRTCTKTLPKYYDRICLKISFLLCTLIQISGKSANLAKISYFYQKTNNKQS